MVEWIGNQFAAKGLTIIGVPNTIDNDLMGTFRTFGFATALAHGGLASEPLSEVGGKVRVIPLEDSLLQAARKLGIYFGDVAKGMQDSPIF